MAERLELISFEILIEASYELSWSILDAMPGSSSGVERFDASRRLFGINGNQDMMNWRGESACFFKQKMDET